MVDVVRAAVENDGVRPKVKNLVIEPSPEMPICGRQSTNWQNTGSSVYAKRATREENERNEVKASYCYLSYSHAVTCKQTKQKSPAKRSILQMSM